MKVRQNLYIDREVSDALTTLAAGTPANKSRLVNDALRDWLDRRGAMKVDDQLQLRLKNINRDIDLARRDLEVLLESLALFVRHQLMVTASVPESDKAAIAIGQERFERFVAQVGRQLAAGRRTLVDNPFARGRS